ncbi:hypothetical protein PYCCODRAFT_1282734 [Trametes coccinea BRFM310]|uniref:DUF6699 domain-containing protein n=1 Tax=Trametes coccinea (strain BRFM310) TaxID=1353009 RepID=A0A1Y2IVA0_TRAC3|nr:hypothetical protein PYCCODRAFT_1282734 [Trametes coccinea BRFM310]
MAGYYAEMPPLVDPGGREYYNPADDIPRSPPVGAGSYFPSELQQQQYYAPSPQPTPSYMHRQASWSPAPSSGYPWNTPASSQTTSSLSTSPSSWPQTYPAQPGPPAVFASPPPTSMPPFIPSHVPTPYYAHMVPIPAHFGAGQYPAAQTGDSQYLAPAGSGQYPAPAVNGQYANYSGYGGGQEQERDRDRAQGLYDGDGKPRRQPSVSSSQYATHKASPSLSRKTSVHREASKRPPREWRSDFRRKESGLFAGVVDKLINTRGKSTPPADVELVLQAKAKPCLHLLYSSSKPPMCWDLRVSPSQMWSRVLKRQLLTADVAGFACEPPLKSLRLYHEMLPWYIDLEARSGSSGLTLYDVFYEIHCCMQHPISAADWLNEEMSPEYQDRVYNAYRLRCANNQQELAMGIKRVDYLADHFVMEGVVRAKNGLWEIKTRTP